MMPALRWVVLLAWLAVALLAVVPAWTMRLWLLSVGVKEYGHWVFLLPVLCALGSPWRTWTGVIQWAIALTAAGLLISSAVQASFYARDLPTNLEKAFGPLSEPLASPPFRWSALWWRDPIAKITPERLVYARHEETELALHFYRSRTPAAPCVIMLHTGGWDRGTPQEFVSFNQLLAQQGYAVAALEYRLAPRWRWPAPREDVRDALHYLQAHHAELGLDATRFIVMGRSAGGQIAEAVLAQSHEPALRGGIAFYAPADLEFAYRFAEPDDMLHSRRLVRQYLGGPPEEHPVNFRDASPIDFVGPATSPILLLHGTDDPLVWNRQSQRFAHQLAKMGVPHLLVELPWATHGSDYYRNGPTGQLSTYAVLYFLQARLRPPRVPLPDAAF